MRWFFALILSLVCSGIHANDLKNECEQTLSIIKPDAVQANHIGAILDHLENVDLQIIAAKMTRLTRERAEAFYAVHKDRPFFSDLVTFMSSGPIFVSVLEGVDAVGVNRTIMGATDPQKAEEGTIRSEFGLDIKRNAVHGSDSLENAKREIAFFFQPNEIYSQNSSKI